jgi:hypothetical protein
MPIIEGLKNLQNGEFFLIRISYVNGKKKETNRYKIIKTDKVIIVKTMEDEDISEKIRRIEISKKGEVLMWINPSRLGLMYNIVNN